MAACTCAGIMAAPPFGTYNAPVWSSMLLVLSFLSFFLWKKAPFGQGQGRGVNRFFNLKTGMVQPLNRIFFMKHDFHQRKQHRIAHAENQASKNEELSNQLYLKSTEMASVIPMGQPILVGHHSEKRDRNYRDKIHNTMGKSVAAGEKAVYYAEKAQTIQSNDAIFSDDPDALQKLEEKLKGLKDNQDFMKSANKLIRKGDKEGFLRLPKATAGMWDQLNVPGWWGKGFAGFSLTNNNANIKRVEQRILVLKNQEAKATVDINVNGVRILENREANRLQLFFDGKPAAEVIKQLKQHGFRWCRSEVAWQRHISNNALYWGKLIAESVSASTNA